MKKLSPKEVDLLSHPVGKGQDVTCPEMTLEFYDLTHCPGYGGVWKCNQRTHTYANDRYGPDTTEYLPCDCGNHLKCPHYQPSLELINKFIRQVRGLQRILQER
jgi:hypothetical protein